MAKTAQRLEDLTERLESEWGELRKRLDPTADIDERLDRLETDIQHIKEQVDALHQQLQPLTDVLESLDDIRASL